MSWRPSRRLSEGCVSYKHAFESTGQTRIRHQPAAVAAAWLGTDFRVIGPLQRVSMIVRLPHKLAERIKVRALETLELNADPFLDFTLTNFAFRRVQYVMMVNTPTLYGVVLPMRGLTTPPLLLNAALGAYAEQLDLDGLKEPYLTRQSTRNVTVRFAGQLDHSVIGSVSELVLQARFSFDDLAGLEPPDGSLAQEVSRRLNDVPMSVLWKRRMHCPRDAMAELIERSAVTQT